MKKILNEFLQRLTFKRQLGIMVTLGVLFLALSSSVVGSWQSNERVRLDLLDQGQHIAENLAHQSALALIYASADNAAEAANAAMAFPGVVSVEIRDVNKRILLTRGKADPAEFPAVAERASWVQGAAVLDAESRHAWRFAAPVYTQPSAESPFTVQTAAPELLGHVSVVMSKAALSQTTTDIFIVNLATSFSFALLFLFLIRFLTSRMTQPLNRLSASMGRAEAGEPRVRAVLTGPKDIADMAQAFNSMMAVLEEREAALSVAAIAFEIEEGMIVTDSNEVIIRVNRVFTKLTGYSAEEAIGKNLSTFKSDRQDAEFYPRMREILHRDNCWQGEIWSRRKNGEVYPEWLTITAVVGKDGKITNYICAFSDISERKAAEQQLRDLSAHMLNVREEEKASIAREIHDDLGGTLTALKMDAYWLSRKLPANEETAPLLERVTSMSQLIDNAVGVTRRIITNLRPTMLDDLGLLAALEWQAAQFHKRTGIECRVNCIEDESELDKQHSIALFRIFQEALTNVARHSGASRVEVEFCHSNEEVFLSVSDNGRGMPEQRTDASISYGILGMTERVEQLGGTIKFDSPPNGGLSVMVILPLPADNKKWGTA